jgi:hypothetical protein
MEAVATVVSCSSPVSCTAIGLDGGPYVFVVTRKENAKTTLRLSKARVAYGHEQQEKLTVTVAPLVSGTPSGSVTILRRGVTVCTLTLKKRTAACTLPAKKFKPGSYHLVAEYHGDAYFNGSSSLQTLIVTG